MPRSTPRHPATALLADIHAMEARFPFTVTATDARAISGMSDWLTRIAAEPSTNAAREKVTAAKAARKAGPVTKISTRERIATQPAAAYPLPDPAVAADALAPTPTFGDPATVAKVTKRGMRAQGAHTA